jgi:hypothetical protein
MNNRVVHCGKTYASVEEGEPMMIRVGVGSSYVEWLLLVESARQDLGLQQREPH